MSELKVLVYVFISFIAASDYSGNLVMNIFQSLKPG
jgi:hypothetical protein